VREEPGERPRAPTTGDAGSRTAAEPRRRLLAVFRLTILGRLWLWIGRRKWRGGVDGSAEARRLDEHFAARRSGPMAPLFSSAEGTPLPRRLRGWFGFLIEPQEHTPSLVRLRKSPIVVRRSVETVAFELYERGPRDQRREALPQGYLENAEAGGLEIAQTWRISGAKGANARLAVVDEGWHDGHGRAQAPSYRVNLVPTVRHRS